MARLLAFLFFVASAVRLYFDWSATRGFLGAEFKFAPIGQVWAEIHFGSLQVAQPAIERYVSPAIWEYGVLPLLLWPMVPVTFGLSLLFWAISRRKKRVKSINKGGKSKDKTTSSVQRER